MSRPISASDLAGTADQFSVGVLCGGRSSRMGRPKPDLEYRGQTFLEIALTRGVNGPLFLSGVASHPRAVGVPDRRSGAGPLAGLEALLDVAETETLVVSPVDTPLLSQDNFRHLHRTLREGDEATLAHDGRRLHAAVGCFRVSSCRPVVSKLLDAGVRRLDAVAEACRCRFVRLPADCLRNVNTPADYEALHRETV